jgi:hypothetical protein
LLSACRVLTNATAGATVIPYNGDFLKSSATSPITFWKLDQLELRVLKPVPPGYVSIPSCNGCHFNPGVNCPAFPVPGQPEHLGCLVGSVWVKRLELQPIK